MRRLSHENIMHAITEETRSRFDGCFSGSTKHARKRLESCVLLALYHILEDDQFDIEIDPEETYENSVCEIICTGFILYVRFHGKSLATALEIRREIKRLFGCEWEVIVSEVVSIAKPSEP